MRNSILLALAVVAGACASLLWTPRAQATEVIVNVEACTPASGHDRCNANHSYTDPATGITFAGWENDSGDEENDSGDEFAKANLTYKDTNSNETGLGVECIDTTGTDKCGEDEINTNPEQYISASLPAAFTSLSIGLASVDSGGGNDMPETAFIYGATCAQINTTCNSANLLDSFTFGDSGTSVTALLNFNAAELSPYSFLYVTPLGSDAPDANILLKSYSYTVAVPEPAALGMFGFGLLLLGGLVGWRRRYEQH